MADDRLYPTSEQTLQRLKSENGVGLHGGNADIEDEQSLISSSKGNDDCQTPSDVSDSSLDSNELAKGDNGEGAQYAPVIEYVLAYTDPRSNVREETVSSLESLQPILDQHRQDSEVTLRVLRLIYTDNLSATSNQFGLKKLYQFGRYRVEIYSSAIIQALASVIQYCPGLNLSSPSFKLDEPFALLYQHRDGLQAHLQSVINATEEHEGNTCKCSRNAVADIRLLLELLETRPEAKKIALERQRHQRLPAVATFDMLWLLFPPGTDVYFDAGGYGFFTGFVVKSLAGGGLNVSSISPFTLTLWSLDFDGYTIGRVEETIQIMPFNGEKEIDTLDVIPCDFYGRDTVGQVSQKSLALRNKLEQNGATFLSLTKRRCIYHSGELHQMLERPYFGRAMVDAESYYEAYPKKKPSLEPPEDDEVVPPPACICSYCTSNKNSNTSFRTNSPFSQYDNLCPSAVDFQGLTPHQQFICAPYVTGFALNTREWLYLRVSNIKECRWNTTMIDRQLSMDSGYREVLKSLVQRYRGEPNQENGDDEVWRADFMMDKGDSQIFLLHGPPGVGKTFTAECVADFLQLPLLSLNCSDIGVKPEKVEDRLRNFFKQAQLWRAVLLLDEADVYLEQRTAQDLQRNCLIAAFLRALEYFRGVLFLTTNRVGPFDDALISRVHMIVHYVFDEAKRQAVWDIFFKKLEHERGRQIKIPYSTREFVKHDKDLAALKWNGREIRNAFQTAVALAEHRKEYDPDDGLISLQVEHFMPVVQMSRNFVGYMKRVRGEPEKYAAHRGDRYEYHFTGESSDGSNRMEPSRS